MDFPGVAKNFFPGWARSGEISFYLLETKKHFLLKISQENVKFQNPGDCPYSPPPSDAHDWGVNQCFASNNSLIA